MVGALKLLRLSLLPTGPLMELVRSDATSAADREALAAILEPRAHNAKRGCAGGAPQLAHVGRRHAVNCGGVLDAKGEPPATLGVQKSLQEAMRCSAPSRSVHDHAWGYQLRNAFRRHSCGWVRSHPRSPRRWRRKVSSPRLASQRRHPCRQPCTRQPGAPLHWPIGPRRAHHVARLLVQKRGFVG